MTENKKSESNFLSSDDLAALRKAFPNMVFVSNFQDVIQLIQDDVKARNASEKEQEEERKEKQTKPPAQPASTAQDAKDRGEAAPCATPLPDRSPDVPPMSHDEIWAFTLATLETITPKIASHLFYCNVLRFDDPLIFRLRQVTNQRRACEEKLIAFRRSSLLEQKKNVEDFKDVLDPRNPDFQKCCYTTACLGEFMVLDFMHCELSVAALMAAVLDRCKARALIERLVSRDPVSGYEDAVRLLRNPGLRVLPEGLLCDHDSYGNIRSGPPGSKYKSRGQLLADLDGDLGRANSAIVRLLGYHEDQVKGGGYVNEFKIENRKDDLSKPELVSLHFHRARILEMKAVVHDQGPFRSPRMQPRESERRLREEQEFAANDQRIRKMFVSGNPPPRDASRTLRLCVQDQLHVMAYLTRFLMPRYRMIVQWLSSPEFAALPANVVRELASRLILCPGAPVDVVLATHKAAAKDVEWKGVVSDPPDLDHGSHEEKWHIWKQPRAAFATDAEFDAYTASTAKFLEQLIFYNRCIRKWFRLHRDLCREFAALPEIANKKILAPMELQLQYFDVRCRWMLLGYIGTSENKTLKSLADEVVRSDSDAYHRAVSSLPTLWDAMPRCVRDLVPAELIDIPSICTPTAWGGTGISRGHRIYTDFIRAHLQLQSSAEAKALKNSPAAAYKHLLSETGSPTWFARRSEAETNRLQREGKLPCNLVTTDKQNMYIISLVDNLLSSGKRRDQLMQARLDLHANALKKLCQLQSDRARLLVDTGDRPVIIRMLLDGLLFPVEEEWNMEHIPKDLRVDFERICYEINSHSRHIISMAHRFREHARQCNLRVQLDPITIRYSMASIQLRLAMASMRSKALKDIPGLASQYKELQVLTLPFLQRQLTQHLGVWRDQLTELKKICNLDQGAGSSITFKIDQVVYNQLVACGV